MKLLCAPQQEAVKNCQYWRLRDQNNKPPGVIGYWPTRAVTFIDNHDTGVLDCPCAAVFPYLAARVCCVWRQGTAASALLGPGRPR